MLAPGNGRPGVLVVVAVRINMAAPKTVLDTKK